LGNTGGDDGGDDARVLYAYHEGHPRLRTGQDGERVESDGVPVILERPRVGDHALHPVGDRVLYRQDVPSSRAIKAIISRGETMLLPSTHGRTTRQNKEAYLVIDGGMAIEGDRGNSTLKFIRCVPCGKTSFLVFRLSHGTSSHTGWWSAHSTVFFSFCVSCVPHKERMQCKRRSAIGPKG
jgi:hypothetical protein